MGARNNVEGGSERRAIHRLCHRLVNRRFAAAEAICSVRELGDDVLGERVHLEALRLQPLKLRLALQNLLLFQAVCLHVSRASHQPEHQVRGR